MRYESPETVEAAISLLAQESGLARVLAGGTDLLVQLRSGVLEPDLVVDIKRIPEMRRIAAEAGGFRIGAAVPSAEVSEHPGVTALWPGVVEAAAGQVSTLQILERVPGLAPEAAGLADPEYTMMFQFTGGVERNIQIGVLTPTERGYYARAEDGEVLIVSVSAVDSLLRLLTDPPYAPTAAPPPASPEAGSTTEATAAP